MIFYCSVKVTVPVFYAQGRVRWPLFASLTAVGANLACAFALNPVLWAVPCTLGIAYLLYHQFRITRMRQRRVAAA